MVCPDGDNVKVIDFGFADTVSLQETKGRGCTRAYASPELLENKSIDQRSDIWSIGILAKDLFGHKFFRIAGKCCRTNPELRYQNIAELRADFIRRRFAPLAISLLAVILCLVGIIILSTRASSEFEPHIHSGIESLPAMVIPDTNSTVNSVTDVQIEKEPTDSEAIEKTCEKKANEGKPSERKANEDKLNAMGDEIKHAATWDLSANETANSYIVNNPGTYSFRADIQGCSNDTIECPANSVAILWESFGNTDQPAPGDLIKTADLEGNRIRFTTACPLRNGNAVIAVKDSSDNILWSWHIWICQDYYPNNTGHTYNNCRAILMDRNLGATSSTPGSIYSIGLMYQWGRKDPFLNFGSFEDNQTAASSTALWPEPDTLDSPYSASMFIRQHPMTFIKKGASKNYGKNRWYEEVKGRQDPCPPGWRVPGRRILQDALGFQNDSSSVFNEEPCGIDFGNSNMVSFSREEKEVWYPASGIRFHLSGRILNGNSHGYYWTSSLNGPYKAAAFIFRRPGILQPNHQLNPHHAMSVRCMKDNK